MDYSRYVSKCGGRAPAATNYFPSMASALMCACTSWYSWSRQEAAAEARIRCELEAASGGKDDGSFSRLLVRGEDRSCKEAGMNVLVLTEALDAGDEVAKGFATHESLHAANRLADYLNSVPHGRTVRLCWCANSYTRTYLLPR